MRSIKIRAWDGKKFLPFANEVAFIHDSGNLRSRIEGVVFSQFTGLLDKHGKEIYEGDLVRDDRWGCMFEVRWGNGKNELLGGQIGWILDDERFCEVGHIISELIAYSDINDHDREDHFQGEVIGNVYEDEHLFVENNA